MLDFFNGLCYNVIKLVAKAITLHFGLLFFNTLKRGALDRVVTLLGATAGLATQRHG